MAETSVFGCLSDTVTKDFNIHPTPVVDIEAATGCWKTPVQIAAHQMDNATRIIQWNWRFGDGDTSNQQLTSHIYSQGGMKTIHLTAIADDGCASNDTTREVEIQDIYVDAGKDTAVQINRPFILSASWTGHFEGIPILSWSPSFGLNTIYGFDPTCILDHSQVYQLTARTQAGCISRDSVSIRVFNTPGILVPTAFTPNHDGLNDILRPVYNGISHLGYFAIYNRWGQLVFRTSDMHQGWNGEAGDRQQAL